MKKILIITISIFLFLVIWQNCQAVELLLEGQYPKIEEQEFGEGGLPGMIKYIYLFALGAAGFVALLSILIGAIMYVFSAGNPSKATDAKNRILSALLGILILLASVLILRTINPDLVNFGFKLPGVCFKSAECISKCKNLCSKPEDAHCAESLDTGTCPPGEAACYCVEE